MDSQERDLTPEDVDGIKTSGLSSSAKLRISGADAEKRWKGRGSTPIQKWLAVKADFMVSAYTEVGAFLRSRGIEPDNYSYRITRGWKRDKLKLVERAQLRAEQDFAKIATKTYTEKIERRSRSWRLLQNSVMQKLYTENADGTMSMKTDIKPSDLLMLTQAYDISVKGERLEDGQPTVVERIDQVNVHTFRMDEMGDDDFVRIEEEMQLALPDDYESIGEDQILDENERGGGDEALATPLLSEPTDIS